MLDLTRFKFIKMELSLIDAIEYFHDPITRKVSDWRIRTLSDASKFFEFEEEDFKEGEMGYSKCVKQMVDFISSVVRNNFNLKVKSDLESAQGKCDANYQYMKASYDYDPYNLDYFILYYYVDRQMYECSAESPNACMTIALQYRVIINGLQLDWKELMDLLKNTGLFENPYEYEKAEITLEYDRPIW